MTSGPIPDYQRHRIASCLAAGYPVERIALATGLPETTIKRQASEPNEAMKQLIDHYRFQQNGMLVKFKMETAELVDTAIEVVGRTLTQEKDPRLAYDASKDILSCHGILFPRDKAAAPQVNTQLNVYGDNRTIDAMTAVAESIKDSTNALKDSLPQVGAIVDSQHISVSKAGVSEVVELADVEGMTAPTGPSSAPGSSSDVKGSNGGTEPHSD